MARKTIFIATILIGAIWFAFSRQPQVSPVAAPDKVEPPKEIEATKESQPSSSFQAANDHTPPEHIHAESPPIFEVFHELRLLADQSRREAAECDRLLTAASSEGRIEEKAKLLAQITPTNPSYSKAIRIYRKTIANDRAPDPRDLNEFAAVQPCDVVKQYDMIKHLLETGPRDQALQIALKWLQADANVETNLLRQFMRISVLSELSSRGMIPAEFAGKLKELNSMVDAAKKDVNAELSAHPEHAHVFAYEIDKSDYLRNQANAILKKIR